MQKCPKCNGTGKISIEKPVTSTEMGMVEEECDLCGGTGYLLEDLMPQVLARLDRIIGILEGLSKKQ